MLTENIQYNSSYCSIKKRSGRWDMPLHYHKNEMEIYYLFSGKVQYIVDNESFVLEDGDVIMIQPNVNHKTVSLSESHERFVLNLPITFIEDDIERMLKSKFYSNFVLTVPPKKRADLHAIILRMEKEVMTTDIFSSKLIDHYIYEFITFVIRNANNSKLNVFNKNPIFIQEIMMFIGKNYTSNITLSQIANEFNLSEAYISRTFKKINGSGIREYLNNVRIDAAMKLLANTNESITNIALKCGFDNSNYFAKVFKEATGTTPLRYRNKK